ncbi:hypothetical protein FQN54_000973 [Arachnomyces sp. PD_36]|nr:hypothetical protein FQN54_000973 [Arachnomyces sp. PD_36]
MRSHLTRSVFRAILANEPCSHSQCQRQLLLSLPRRSVGRLHPSPIQSRTLFGLPIDLKPETQRRQGQDNSTDPGLVHMVNLSKALQQRSRPPSPAVLAKAFQDFISARLEYPGKLTDFHARFLLGTFEHLQKQKGASDDELEGSDPAFLPETLEDILLVLSEAECDPLSYPSVQQLARLVFQELEENEGYPSAETVEAYITVLSATGAPDQARSLVEKFWEQLAEENGTSCWLAVLKGYARQGVKQEVDKAVARLSEFGVSFDQAMHEEVTLCMINENRTEEAKIFYERGISGDRPPTAATNLAIFKMAVFIPEHGWAEQLFESMSQDPPSETLDALLLWSVVKGHDAEQLNEKLEAIISKDPGLRDALTISSFNNLVEYANHIGDHLHAEAYASLAHQWGLQPDAQTYLLLLQTRMLSGNSSGIVEPLQRLADEDALDNIDVSLLNRLVISLTADKRVEVERDLIISIVDRLVERSVRLDPQTLESICRMLLHNNDLDAASEILRPQLDSYNMEERTKIREAFLRFILDPKQDDEIVWETYELVKLAFPETSVKQRTAVMNGFFRRKRTDLACLVFGHMRQNEDFRRRPKPDTYARCFQGIARSADRKSLELVHNMLKLDLEVELDTRILNGLMLAYAACEMPEKSLNFFQDILHSDEGPSNNSIAIFLRVCETHHDGVEEAMKMMDKLKHLEIYISRRVYTAYIGALAGQREFERAAEAIRTMEAQTGYTPTGFTIATFYNAMPYPYWKDQVEEWAQSAFPELWKEVEGFGYTEDEDGTRNYNIDRDLHV